ncbi:MAG TPA: hypothetical protein VM243_14200 [Phycisphaerae bacterium]|nr:hypothetical protein [Phycisphaerae bacterium]
MWRTVLLAGLVVLSASGCDIVVPAATVEPGAIPSVQFLRPVRDDITGTWVAGWIDPDNFSGATATGQ